MIKKVNKIIKMDELSITLELNNGGEVILDRNDYERIKDFNWFRSSHKTVSYAVVCLKTERGWRSVRMHRYITNCPSTQEVDHINNNGLDNRRCNLRVCDPTDNCKNRRLRSDNTSAYKGVHQRYNGRWQARIVLDGKRISLGHFASALEAAKAYNQAAICHYGEYASTNFTD